MSYSLTKVQAQLLQFIKYNINQTGVAPSYDEMAHAIGRKSKSGINRLVRGLEARGKIRRLSGLSRAIEVLDDRQMSGQKIRRALVIIRARGCENYFGGGLGACYHNGRKEEAQYRADKVCPPCLADRALKEE